MKKIHISNSSSIEIPRHALMRLANCALGESELRPPPGEAMRIELVSGAGAAPGGSAIKLSAQGFMRVHRTVEGVEGLLGEASRPAAGRRVPAARGARLSSPPLKTLLFRNIMGHNFYKEISQASLALASAIRRRGGSVIFTDARVNFEGDGPAFYGEEELREILETEKPGLVGLTLLEAYFKQLNVLASFIRSRSDAYIVIGGIMPTASPGHVFAHVDAANAAVRGSGEDILPELAQILAGGNASSQLVDRQIDALLGMKGIMFHAGGNFISSDIGHVNETRDIDGVALDLSLLEARDIEKGLTISSSRGCLNACRFCSLPIKKRYYGISPGRFNKLLGEYYDRLPGIFGGADKIPASALTVNFCDEDFLGDPQRAMEIFSIIRKSPFKITSFEACVSSFYLPSGKINKKLLNSITPDLFLKTHRAGAVPPMFDEAYFTPYRPNPFIQLGTESFCELEIKYLGKNHTLAQIRELSLELSSRGIYHCHYVIMSNRRTSAENVISSINEMVKQKLINGRYFEVRDPVVKKLVSYQSTSTFREAIKDGDESLLAVSSRLSIPEYPECDYMFVEADNAEDEIARAIAEDADSVIEYEGFYLETLDNLKGLINRRFGDRGGRVGARAQSLIGKIVSHEEVTRKALEEKSKAMARLKTVNKDVYNNLLKDLKQLQVFFNYSAQKVARLNLIVTHDCQLRCRYCDIKKSPKTISSEVVDAALRMVSKTRRDEIKIMFFGVEPLLVWNIVKECVQKCDELRKTTGKKISYYLTTNAVALSKAKLDYIDKRDFEIEISLDGTPETQKFNRRGRDESVDSYKNLYACMPRILKLSIPYHFIMVTHPESVHCFYENFKHLADLGIKRIQTNFACGRFWSEEHMAIFAEQLNMIGEAYLFRKDCDIEYINANGWEGKLYLFNNEVTVDIDGTVYSGNSFLVNPVHGRTLVMGNVLNTDKSTDYYDMNRVPYGFLERTAYPIGIMKTNWQMERVMSSFIKKYMAIRNS